MQVWVGHHLQLPARENDLDPVLVREGARIPREGSAHKCVGQLLYTHTHTP